MRRPPLAAALLLTAAVAAVAVAVAGCGREERASPDRPSIGLKGTDGNAATDLGFPAFATKNTTRVGGADPVADAAGVARAVWPAGSRATRPAAVALVDARDWRAGVAAAVLAAPPVRAPILLANGREMPDASQKALAALRPLGSKAAGGAEVIRVGDVPRPEGFRTTDVTGRDAYALARALDALTAAARGSTSERVIVTTGEDAAYAMPAAGWAAKQGDPVLFVERDRIPAETRAALEAHQQPRIYVLGPRSVISAGVERGLRRLGAVKRIAGSDPIANAIAFARYLDPPFGWGVVDPGHGLVFARADRPLDAAAGAPLSASGKYGPLLLLGGPDRVDPAVVRYLLDIQPGYQEDPVRAVYNHGWVLGDDRAISVAAQSRLDALLEIVPVDSRDKQQSSP